MADARQSPSKPHGYAQQHAAHPQAHLHAQQHAGQHATQIGSVGGNVVQHIQHVRQDGTRSGFWSFLSVSVVTGGAFLILFLGLGLYVYFEDPNAGSDPPFADNVGGWPPAGEPVYQAGDPAIPVGLPSASFPLVPSATTAGMGSSPWQLASLGQFDAVGQQEQAQLLETCRQVIQHVNSVETAAVATRDPTLAASVFTGEPLRRVQQQITELRAAGEFYQATLESFSVLAARVVSQSATGLVLEIDTCEHWSGTRYDSWQRAIATDPQHAVPQTITVELRNGQSLVTGVNFNVGFRACS